MADGDPNTCAHKDCKPPQPVEVRFDHPAYSSAYGTCKQHEPRRCGDCNGHILGGECHCD